MLEESGEISGGSCVSGYLELEADLISELQAPLLGIAANARVAGSSLKSGNERVSEYLEAIEFSSANLVRTIDILLRSRDVANSELSLNLEPLHLGVRVEEAIEKLVPLCKTQAQIIDFKIKKNLLVSSNKECLDLVIYHILEQSLRCSASEEIVSIELRASGSNAMLKIRLEGCRERALSFRKSLKRILAGEIQKSTGFNFSLVASTKLLDLMDGRFSVSQRRDGVNFNILIPLSAQSSFIF